MTSAAKRKGDQGEREVEALLRETLGISRIRRALGAGRKDDVGDILHVPYTAIQVARWEDIQAAIRIKLPAVEVQRRNLGVPFAATFVRRRRSPWIVVMTPEQFARLWRAAARDETRRSRRRASAVTLPTPARHDEGS